MAFWKTIRFSFLYYNKFVLSNGTKIRFVSSVVNRNTYASIIDNVKKCHFMSESKRIWELNRYVQKLAPVSHRFYSEGKRQVEVTFDELQALTRSGDIRLIDVREPDELEEYGRIPGAVNIPLSLLKGALIMTDEAFQEHYKCAKPQKHDTNIVFYGLGPIKSTAAHELSYKIGYKKARHYRGGWEEYSQRTGQPLKRSASN